MKKIILLFVLLGIIFLISAQTNFYTYYQLDLNYNRGEINLINSDIYFSDFLLENNFGFYSAIIKDFENNSLNIFFFDIPKNILYDEIDENGTIVSGGEAESNNVDFTIYIPYYENATEIKIYNENLEEKLLIDVSEYSKEFAEEKEIAAEDSQIEDKDINHFERQREETKGFLERVYEYWWILLIVLIILLFILFKSLSKKK